MQTLDQTKAEMFAQRMLDILNSGAIALMTSIGHRTAYSIPWLNCHPPPVSKLLRPQD